MTDEEAVQETQRAMRKAMSEHDEDVKRWKSAVCPCPECEAKRNEPLKVMVDSAAFNPNHRLKSPSDMQLDRMEDKINRLETAMENLVNIIGRLDGAKVEKLGLEMIRQYIRRDF